MVSNLALSTSAVSPGAPVAVRSEVRNIGDAPAGNAVGAPVSAGVMLGLFRGAADPGPFKPLSAWALPGGYPMAPGETRSDERTVLAPSTARPGPYFVCAEVDPENALAEADEKNNRTCKSLSILASPVTRADLIVERVRTLGYELASVKVSIRVKNVGDAPAGAFPVMAFTRWPRRPVMLTACALTEAQRAAGSTPACGALWTRQHVPPGGAAEWIGYLTFGFGGSTMPVTPVGPQRQTARLVTVDIMADGCFAPTDRTPLPQWCRVEEIDEINNFAELAVRVK